MIFLAESALQKLATPFLGGGAGVIGVKNCGHVDIQFAKEKKNLCISLPDVRPYVVA
jgi:hypothetical protein